MCQELLASFFKVIVTCDFADCIGDDLLLKGDHGHSSLLFLDPS